MGPEEKWFFFCLTNYFWRFLDTNEFSDKTEKYAVCGAIAVRTLGQICTVQLFYHFMVMNNYKGIPELSKNIYLESEYFKIEMCENRILETRNY